MQARPAAPPAEAAAAAAAADAATASDGGDATTKEGSLTEVAATEAGADSRSSFPAADGRTATPEAAAACQGVLGWQP